MSDKDKITDLFLKFNNWYGQSWSNRFPTQGVYDEAVNQWAEEFNCYSEDIIKRACDVCKDRYDLAPTLPQFFKILKSLQQMPAEVRESNHGECSEPDCCKAAEDFHLEEERWYCKFHWDQHGGVRAQFFRKAN